MHNHIWRSKRVSKKECSTLNKAEWLQANNAHTIQNCCETEYNRSLTNTWKMFVEKKYLYNPNVFLSCTDVCMCLISNEPFSNQQQQRQRKRERSFFYDSAISLPSVLCTCKPNYTLVPGAFIYAHCTFK